MLLNIFVSLTLCCSSLYIYTTQFRHCHGEERYAKWSNLTTTMNFNIKAALVFIQTSRPMCQQSAWMIGASIRPTFLSRPQRQMLLIFFFLRLTWWSYAEFCREMFRKGSTMQVSRVHKDTITLYLTRTVNNKL